MFFLLAFQWVQDKYMSRGWTQHHEHTLEYEETNAKNPKPFISVRVTDPANDKEKNWQVTIISAVPVSYTCRLLFLFKLFDFHLSSLSHTIALCVCIFVCYSLKNQLWIS